MQERGRPAPGPGALRTVNVLVTDTIGSTSTLVRDGADAADRQRRRHDQMVANVVAVFGGRIVKSTGDGALAELPSADDLVRAGSALREAAATGGYPLRVGMATGDALVERDDLFGEAVVVAARLCDECPAGAVLVDAGTLVVRGNRHQPALTSHGRLVLRGFDQPREVWAVTGSTSPPPRSVPPEPAVGRDRDVDRVRQLMGGDDSVLVVLTGEPGIGKTHLARAALGADAVVVRSSAPEGDGFVAWCAALDDAVAAMPVGAVAALGPDVVRRAATVLPGLAGRLPATRADLLPEAGREETLDALATLVELVDRPLLLDDVQWAGPTATAFLRRLVTSTTGVRVLATSRLPVPADVRRAATALVAVGRLSDDAIAELLAQRGVSADAAAGIARRAEGNALLAVVAAGGRSVEGEDPVAAAFLTLPDDELEVLCIAGLLGRDVDLVLLEHLTGRHATELAALLQAAVRSGLLAGGETLSFVHDLVREAAASTLPAHRRVALHAVAGTALERRGDTLAAVDHVLRGFGALDVDDAVETLAAGCELLAERLAFEDMLAVAVRLQHVLDGDARARPRHAAAALLLVSWAHELLGDVRRHKDAALAAGEIARASGADHLLVEAALSRAGYGFAGLADPQTIELLDAALAVVPDDDDARRARLTAMRAFYLLNDEGRGAEARATSAAALVMARRRDDPDVLAEVLANRTFVLLASSLVGEQAALADELEAVAAELAPGRRRIVLASMHRNSGPLRLQLGDRAGFSACHRSVRAAADGLHSWLLGAIATLWDGLEALLDGDPADAEERAAALLAAHPDEPNLSASASGLLASALRWRGTLRGHADELIAFGRQRTGLPIGTTLAAVALALSGSAEGGAVLDEVLDGDRPLVDDSTLGAQLATIVEACALTGRPVPATVRAGLDAFAGQVIVTAWGVDVPGAADRFGAIDAALAGDRPGAAAAFDRARALEAKVSAPLAMRTQVWRHVLLGDVPMPEVPPPLAGLAIEAEALRAARAR